MKPNAHNITSINVNGNVFCNGQVIAETFNKYSVSVAQNIHRITTMIMLHPNMKTLYLTQVGHLINHSQLLILNMYHLKKWKT
jgi:hypothetical protein